MRRPLPAKLETARQFGDASWGGYGAFLIHGPCGAMLKIVSSAGDLPGDDTGWEHASVSRSGSRQPPNWLEMCFVKDLFWHEEDCVMQFHPPRSAYVNNHPGCLHLFRPVDGVVRMPPAEMVGLSAAGENLTAGQAAQAFKEYWRDR